MRRALIATLGLLAAGCAETAGLMSPLAPYAPASDVVVTPSWAERAPTASDILSVYPARALRSEVSGLVILDCTVRPERTLACHVGEDTVPGYGFGEAALKVADLFVVKEGVPNASPGARIRVPVRFVPR